MSITNFFVTVIYNSIHFWQKKARPLLNPSDQRKCSLLPCRTLLFPDWISVTSLFPKEIQQVTVFSAEAEILAVLHSLRDVQARDDIKKCRRRFLLLRDTPVPAPYLLIK